MTTQGAPEIDDFLSRAALRGERSVASLRISLCALGLVNNLFFAGGLAPFLAGDGVALVRVGTMAMGIVFSVAMIRRLRKGGEAGWLLGVSAVIDSAIALTILGLLAWSPNIEHNGLLTVPAHGILVLAVVAAGFRLDSRVVAAASSTVVIGATALLVAERSWRPGQSALAPTHYISFGIMLMVAILISLAYVRRTRTLVLDGARAAVHAERARQRLGVYVSQEIADFALSADRLELGGQRRLVTVLFSDLRGFTRYSEKISPERLVSELNAYLDVMVTVVRKHGGMVDKYIGDAIMVVFGLPEPQPDAPLRALRAAAEMQAALLVHNADRERRGLPPLQQGIGVHHGHAIAGNIGTEDRLQYTVIGDVVNLASRLESVTKERGVSSLFSQDVVDAAQATGQETPPLAAAGSVQARGRDGSIEVYTLR